VVPRSGAFLMQIFIRNQEDLFIMSREFNVGRTMTQNYSSVIGRPEPVAHPLNCNAECPYGKGKSFCFPCMAKIMEEHNAAKKGNVKEADTKEAN